MLFDELHLGLKHALGIGGHGAGRDAVAGDDPGDKRHLVAQGDAQAEIAVLGGAHRLIEEANFVDALAAECKGGAGQLNLPHVDARRDAAFGEPTIPQERFSGPAILVDAGDAAIGEASLRRGFWGRSE